MIARIHPDDPYTPAAHMAKLNEVIDAVNVLLVAARLNQPLNALPNRYESTTVGDQAFANSLMPESTP